MKKFGVNKKIALIACLTVVAIVTGIGISLMKDTNKTSNNGFEKVAKSVIRTLSNHAYDTNDTEAPTITDEDIQLSNPINVDDPVWRRQEYVIVKKATDNVTAEENINYEFCWTKWGIGLEVTEEEQWNTAVFGTPMTKTNDNGIFIFKCRFTDEAGNVSNYSIGPFFLDSKVSDTEMGTLEAKKKDGTAYTFTEKTTTNGTKYYEGAYISDEIYINKKDGGIEEGKESGHEKTTYEVKQIVYNDEGEYTETDTAVGGDSRGNAILYRDVDYLVKVKTTDNAENSGTMAYIIHKGANINFNPDGKETPSTKVSVEAKLTDTENEYSDIGYAWVKEKDDGKVEGPENWTSITDINELSTGTTITSPVGVKGNYYLYIRTQDSEGNVNIVKSNRYNLQAQIENPGQIEFRENDESGKIIDLSEENEIKTSANIWVNIKEQGSDEYGKVNTTFEITKENDGTEMGSLTLERAELTDEGKYTVKVTSTRTNASNPELDMTGDYAQSTTYTIYVDKTEPNVKFEKITQDNVATGQIKVTVDDNGDAENQEISGVAQTGVNQENLRYYWTNGNYTPTKDDFFGVEDEYRGKITSTTRTINTPNGASGIWVLWVYAEDNVGNVKIAQDRVISANDTVIDNDAPIAGKIIATKIDGEEKTPYTAGTEDTEAEITNKYVEIELLPGYDSTSGVSSNTYRIVKGDSNGNSFKILEQNPEYVETNEETQENAEIAPKYIEETVNGNNSFEDKVILTEHGVYTVEVKTIDNAATKHSAVRTYKIKIDKSGPQVTVEPNENTQYAKQHEMEVNITEPETEAGDDTSKTKYIWVGYYPNETRNMESIIEGLREYSSQKLALSDVNGKQIVEEISKEESIRELEEYGIYVIPTTVSQTIKTPDSKTGKFFLIVYAEDKLGNSSVKLSKEFFIDNTNPTKPSIRGTKKELVGTSVKDVEYYGEKVSKDITVIAENSESLSGVDKYEYCYTTDNGANWSEWTDGTFTENDVKKGRALISEEGRIVVKFRSIAELIDGELISEDSEEFTVVIDKTGPRVAFSNTENGENGSKVSIENIKVRVTVTDNENIAENTLKYNWVKFESIEEFEEFQNADNTLNDLKTKMDIENAKNFSNGEPIPSPEGLEGIYSLFVYAEDELGNATIATSDYYAFNLAKEANSPYELDGKYVTKVIPETTVEQFTENVKSLVTGTEYVIYDKAGNEIYTYTRGETASEGEAEEEDEEVVLVTTASTVKVDGVEYTIVVMGDLNADGKMNGIDIARMRYNRLGKLELEGAYANAADLNKDGKIDGRDLVKMRLINVGLADYTE